MEFKDYYALLGVTPETTTEDIKKAYRKLARKYHPDVSKLPDAEARFKEINEAWEVLQDPEKRKQYDAMRQGGGSQQSGFGEGRGNHFYTGQGAQDDAFQGEGDFSEFFNSIFGGAARGRAHRTQAVRGQDIHAKIEIPLTMAYQGGVQALQLQTMKPTPEGRAIPEIKTLQVKIPPGVTEGSQIRLKGQGGEGFQGAPSGDLYIKIHLKKDPLYSVHHKDIHLKLPITPWEAALGATISVPTLGGEVNVKIPKDAQTDQKMRLKGRGLPGEPTGDQYVILQIQTPQANNPQAIQLYEEMAKLMPFDPRAQWRNQHG